MKKFYPIFLDVAGKRAVVVGGGPVAARKAFSLLAAGADVTVVSPELAPELARLVEKGVVRHRARRYQRGDIAHALVAVAATDDPDTNLAVAMEAHAEGVLINCVNPPQAGDFIVPSSIRRGGLTLAVSTGGVCPALSKRLRKDLESFLGREYGSFLEFLEEARAALKGRLKDEKAREEALTALVDSSLVESFREGPADKALNEGREMLEELIKRLNVC